MKCLNPLAIRGNIVPCGKCIICLSNRRKDWAMRLNEELKVSSSAFFVTLTYDDVHLPTDDDGVPSVCKRDVQLFIKRLRKKFSKDRIRYFLCSEYGPKTGRPHYHAIIFNLPIDNSPRFVRTKKVIQETWQQGNVDVGTVTGKSINYVAKYCLAYSDWVQGDPFGVLSCSVVVIPVLALISVLPLCRSTVTKPKQIPLFMMEYTGNYRGIIVTKFLKKKSEKPSEKKGKSVGYSIENAMSKTRNTGKKSMRRKSSYTNARALSNKK